MALSHDIRYSVRSLRKSPGFTIAALVVLMLGIGANSAIFSVVNAVLLRPLPIRDSHAVVTVLHRPPAKAFPGVDTFPVSPANYLDWRAENDVFETMAVYDTRMFRRTEKAGRPESVRATITEASFFDVLKPRMATGRQFFAEECQPGHDDVIVVSDYYAQEQFGSAAGAVGKSIRLNDRSYRVVGVLSPKFRVRSWDAADSQIFAPLSWKPEERVERKNHTYGVVARLKNGISVQQAQAKMNLISTRLEKQHPEANTGWGAVVTPLRDSLVGEVRPALLTLLGAVTFVLLIACANVANLVLARTLARRKELGIRLALGASSARAMRVVMVETTMLSLAGGALGLVFAEYAVALVVATLASQMPRSTEVALDARVLVFTLLVSLIAGLAAGALAAWRSIGFDVNDSLKQGMGKTDALSSGQRARNWLVVAEVALSLMLLVGAGLMLRSLWALHDIHPGFEARNVMTSFLSVPRAGEVSQLYTEALPAIRALPGVESVGAVDSLPLSGGSHQPVMIEGRPAEVFAMQPNIDVRAITPGYIAALRIPIIQGRDLTEADTTSKFPVVLISDSMARSYWPGENPIGKRLTLSFTPDIKREVVGIVGDVKLRGVDVLEPVPMIYEPMTPTMLSNVALVIRGSGDATALMSDAGKAMARIDPQATIRSAKSMEAILTESLSPRRFNMLLFTSFAGLALLLAAVGIYSVLAYGVRSRLHEISIRMAVGAQVSDIVRLVMLEGLRRGLGRRDRHFRSISRR